MAADPPPAEFEVSHLAADGGVANVYACAAHLAHTIRVIWASRGTAGVAVKPADPSVHGCKGHLENWPAAE